MTCACECSHSRVISPHMFYDSGFREVCGDSPVKSMTPLAWSSSGGVPTATEYYSTAWAWIPETLWVKESALETGAQPNLWWLAQWVCNRDYQSTQAQRKHAHICIYVLYIDNILDLVACNKRQLIVKKGCMLVSLYEHILMEISIWYRPYDLLSKTSVILQYH